MDAVPLLISLKTASLAMLVTFFTGLAAAAFVVSLRSRLLKTALDAFLTLPLVLPPTVAGFFLLAVFGVRGPIGAALLEFFAVRLVFSWPATVLAAVVVAFPLMYRSSRGALEQLDPSLLWAARTLGMSEARIFVRVSLPTAFPGILSGAILSFARGLGEFGATAMIAGNIAGKTRTLPLAIYSEVAAGNMDSAARYVLVILCVSFFVVAALNYTPESQPSRRAEAHEQHSRGKAAPSLRSPPLRRFAPSFRSSPLPPLRGCPPATPPQWAAAPRSFSNDQPPLGFSGVPATSGPCRSASPPNTAGAEGESSASPLTSWLKLRGGASLIYGRDASEFPLVKGCGNSTVKGRPATPPQSLESPTLRVAVQKRLSGTFTLCAELEVTPGRRLGILGASGAGKSMTLKCAAGIERPDSGRITLGPTVLFDAAQSVNQPPQKRRVGYLFQHYALFPRMTIWQNLTAASRASQSSAERTLARELLERFELTGLETRYPHQLSGGQQQRAALARLLIRRPAVLLLDEPFAALDSALRETILARFPRYLPDNTACILVTHSHDEVYRLCNELAIMENGHILARGLTRELFANPRTIAAARLTGCRNISRAEPTGERTIRALDWGLTLRTAAPVPPGIRAVGIHAHNIVPAAAEGPNTLHPAVCAIQEDPIETTIIFVNAGATTPQTAAETNHLWWKHHNGQPAIPPILRLPEDALLLLQ